MICSLAFALCSLSQSTVAAADCPSVEASVVKAEPPAYPDSARRENVAPAMVLVEVTIAPDGKPLNAMIYKSAGRADLDRAALRAARQSQYSAKTVNCQPVTGEYLFRVVFQPSGDVGKFLKAPAFTPPQGWDESKTASPPSGLRSFGEWTHGDRVIGVMAGFTDAPMSKAVDSKTTLVKNSGGTMIASEPARLCDGNTIGWKLTYIAGQTQYTEMVEVVDNRLYDAYYYGSAAPDSAIAAAMNSLCGR